MRADTITRHTVDPVAVAAIEAGRTRTAYTASDLAEYWRVHPRTVRRWAQRGLIERDGRGLYRGGKS